MKKWIALLLAVMMFCLCAACGGSEPAAEEPAQAPAEAAAPAEAPAAPAEPEPPVEEPAAPAEPEAPAAGEASGEPAGDASGEPSGEASGAPTPAFYEPTDAYAKDFEGYRQYVIDAFATDPGAPEDLKEAYHAEFLVIEDDTGTTVQALIGLGLICSYEDFLAY